MKFFLFFLMIFSFNLFATSYVLAGYHVQLLGCYLTRTDSWGWSGVYKLHYISGPIGEACGGNYYPLWQDNYSPVDTCPTGQVPDTNNICVIPATCSWATNPPYLPTGLSQANCSNVNRVQAHIDSKLSYLWNNQWCDADSQCYGREYFCPAGQLFNSGTRTCTAPVPPVTGLCVGENYFTRTGSVAVNGVESCFQDFVCKSSNKVVKRSEVSCGAVAASDLPSVNPYTPDQSVAPAAPIKAKDTVKSCWLQQMEATYNCQAPNVLKFSCDVTTNVATTSCVAQTETTKTTVDSADSTAVATTADIKNLSNSLPDSVRNALKDYLSDGSMPYLESIKGSLDASVILQADANDKLDTISASTDAGLALQSDANDKLDTLNETMKEGKTDQAFPGFNDSPDVAVPEDHSSLFSDIHDFANQIISDASGISTQYDNAKSALDNGFQPVSLPSGGCQDITFSILGSGVISVIPMCKAPELIAPYSPIFSLLVYVVVMFFIFRFLFLFFISRSR